jgi:hypothetical protein
MDAWDDCLKRSAHFADVINMNRLALAEVMTALLRPMVESGAVDMTTVLDTLKGLERGTARPSVDGERRHAVSAIREAIQQWK